MMDRYTCSICGETYDPKEGLAQYDIDPGISFEDLPDEWNCTMCGAEKHYYIKEKLRSEF